MIVADSAVKEIEDFKVIEPALSIMTSNNLLVAVFIVTRAVISTGSYGNATILTYPARVLNTTQGECPSDVQREMVMAEVKEDICNLLLMFLPIRKWIHLMCKLPITDSLV